jgi:hypothetical protein
MVSGRDRIEILDRKTQMPSWMIVCDAEPGPPGENGLPKYSHHWTGWWWEPSGGDEFHVYTSRESVELSLKDEMRRMLLTLPGTWTAKLMNWWNRRSFRRATE